MAFLSKVKLAMKSDLDKYNPTFLSCLALVSEEVQKHL